MASKARLAHLEYAGSDSVLESSRAGVLVRRLCKAHELSDLLGFLSLTSLQMFPLSIGVLMSSGPVSMSSFALHWRLLQHRQ